MEFKDIIEFMTLEHVLEGIGAATGIGIMWKVFFDGGITYLVQLLMTLT